MYSSSQFIDIGPRSLTGYMQQLSSPYLFTTSTEDSLRSVCFGSAHHYVIYRYYSIERLRE